MKFFQVKTFCTTRVEIVLIPSNSSKQNQSPYHGERGVKAKKATSERKEEVEHSKASPVGDIICKKSFLFV